MTPEFVSDEDIGVGMDFDTQVEPLLNTDPLVVGLVPTPSPPVAAAGTSSSRPRRRRITRLSQAQRATILVEDVDSEEEEQAVTPSGSEFEAKDIGLLDV